jgi:hypothetical protein
LAEGPFELHPDEIETGAWFTPERVTTWVQTRPQDFASSFVAIWKQAGGQAGLWGDPKRD